MTWTVRNPIGAGQQATSLVEPALQLAVIAARRKPTDTHPCQESFRDFLALASAFTLAAIRWLDNTGNPTYYQTVVNFGKVRAALSKAEDDCKDPGDPNLKTHLDKLKNSTWGLHRRISELIGNHLTPDSKKTPPEHRETAFDAALRRAQATGWESLHEIENAYIYLAQPKPWGGITIPLPESVPARQAPLRILR